MLISGGFAGDGRGHDGGHLDGSAIMNWRAQLVKGEVTPNRGISDESERTMPEVRGGQTGFATSGEASGSRDAGDSRWLTTLRKVL